jgi:hypothetical protein
MDPLKSEMELCLLFCRRLYGSDYRVELRRLDNDGTHYLHPVEHGPSTEEVAARWFALAAADKSPSIYFVVCVEGNKLNQLHRIDARRRPFSTPPLALLLTMSWPGIRSDAEVTLWSRV